MSTLKEKYSEMRGLLKKGNDCNPFERKRFYDLKIDLLKAKRDEYEFWPEERANIERKRIKAICGLSKAIDGARTYQSLIRDDKD